MTISSATRKSPVYVGSGTTGPFAFSFKVFAASDVKVTTSVIATGVETELAEDAYTVILNADQNGNPGGTVTLDSALGTTQNLVITSKVPLTQPVDINNQDGFFAEVIEDALDRHVMQVQQMQVDVDRAVKLPLTDSITSADQLVQDLFDSVADAEAAELAAEAAQAAAETAQTNAETAETGAQTAESNALSYANSATGIATRVFTSYATAISTLVSESAADGTEFVVKAGERSYLYKFYTDSTPVSPASKGDLQTITPAQYPEATFASASSAGVTTAGTALPAGPIIDVAGVDGTYGFSQIRNRAKVGLPNLNLFGTSDPSKAPLRSFWTEASSAPGAGVLSFNFEFGGENHNLLVVFNGDGTTPTYSVSMPDIVVPPGRWTLAFEDRLVSGSGSYRWAFDGTTYSETATSSWTERTVSIVTAVDASKTLTLFQQAAGATTVSQIGFRNVRLIPGASTSYTEPANRHGWHKRPWSLETGALVPTNDSESVDNLHMQVPLGETREITECTLSVAIRPTSNKPYQITNVTYPDAQPFSVLAQPSREFLPDYSVTPAPSLTYPYTSAGYLGFNNLGSTDDVVQVTGIALPKDKFSILTIVEPAEQGVNSSPTRIYLNGILLQNVEDSIRVKTSSVTNDGGVLRFNFGKPHYFVGDQPVTVTISGGGAAYPTGTEAGVTYYVRLPATNPQEGLYLASTVGGDPIEWASSGSGSIYINSQKRPVGTVPFQLDTLSLLGAGTTESASIITGYDAGLNPVYSTVGLNMEGEFANAVFYDKALTESEVQNLVAVQKQRIAAHYEPVSSLGSVLITEGDSITNGVGTTQPSETFRYRLFYGLDFTPQTTSSITSDDGAKDFTSSNDGSGVLLLTFASDHQFEDDNEVQVAGANLPDALSAGVTYYVKKIDATTMNLSATAGGAVIPYGSTSGSGTQTMTFADNKLLLTFASNHGYDTGDSVQVSSSNTLPTGLTGTGLYYVQKRSNTTMYLSTLSLVTSPAINYADAGIGTVTISAFVPSLVNDAVKLNTIDFSVGGSRIGDTIGRKDALIAAVQRVVAEGSRPVVTYMAGLNDLILGSLLNPGTPITNAELATLVELLKSYWDDIRAAGAKLIVGTVTAANVGGSLSGHYSEALRTELNNLIRAASDHYDALADFGATPQIGTWQDPNDPPSNPNSYFFDDIHPDFQGHIVMSNILSPLVDAFRL